MAKQSVDAARGSIFRLDPFAIIIEGLDTDSTSDVTYDERVKLLRADLPAMRALIDDIKIEGVLQPIIVTKDGELLKVVAGRRRVFAARVASKELSTDILVPAMSPVKGTEVDIFRRLITENELRVDDVQSVKAAKCLRMLNYMAGGAEPTKDHFAQLATIFGGVSPQTIKNYLAFSGLASKVQKMVDDGLIAATAAVQLAQLSREDQIKTAEEMIASGVKPTVEKARAARNKKTGKGKEDERPKLKQLRDMARLALADKAEGRKVYVSDEIFDFLRILQGEIGWGKLKGLSELCTRAESGME